MTTEEVQKLRPIPDGFVRLVSFMALVGIAVVALLMVPYTHKYLALEALVFMAVLTPILNGPSLLRMGYPTVRQGLRAYRRRNLAGHSLVYHTLYNSPSVFKYGLRVWHNEGREDSYAVDMGEVTIVFCLGGFFGLVSRTAACRLGSPSSLSVAMTIEDVLENPDDPMVLAKDAFGNRLRLHISQALEIIYNTRYHVLTDWVKSHQYKIVELEEKLQAYGQLKSNEKELENCRQQAEQAEAERKEHQGYHARLHALFAEALAVIPGAINMIDTSDRIKNQVEGRQLRKHLFEVWGTLLKAVVGIPDARAKDQARQANQEMIDRVFSSSR